jgi:hypothetical protein
MWYYPGWFANTDRFCIHVLFRYFKKKFRRPKNVFSLTLWWRSPSRRLRTIPSTGRAGSEPGSLDATEKSKLDPRFTGRNWKLYMNLNKKFNRINKKLLRSRYAIENSHSKWTTRCSLKAVHKFHINRQKELWLLVTTIKCIRQKKS